MLYSSSMPVADADAEPADANTYRPFKLMDSIIMKSITREINALGEPETEGTSWLFHRGSVPLTTQQNPLALLGHLQKRCAVS